MIGRLSRNQLLVVGGVVIVVAAAAVSAFALAGGDKKSAAPPSPVVTSSSAPTSVTPSPTTSAPAPKPTPRLNPLTGVGPAPTGPIIAVKVDDTASGRPSRGIDQADVIYIEQAEGGLTRMVAVFGTHLPVVE